MSLVCRHTGTKKPATVQGRGLAVGAHTGERRSIVMTLLQLHSISVGSWLLLGQAMDIAATQ